MKTLLLFILLIIILPIKAETLKDDPRYCGFVPRDSSGGIKRNLTMLKKFQRIHPCPSTGLTTENCPGWEIDHILSLAIGGCDQIQNMQWLPNKIKTCSSGECKDRWERNVHDIPIETPGFKPLCCTLKLIKFE